MKPSMTHIEPEAAHWCENLFTAFNLGLPNIFNFEWLIEKAERGEWSGLWG